MYSLSSHVLGQIVGAMKSLLAAFVSADVSLFCPVAQLMASAMFRPCEDLVRISDKIELGDRFLIELTLPHPGNSHVCTRFPFLALLIRLSPTEEVGEGGTLDWGELERAISCGGIFPIMGAWTEWINCDSI